MNKNVICRFEIYVKDMERAKQFYSAVSDTQFYDAPAPPDNNGSFKMPMFTPPADEGSYVSGALTEMPGTKEGDGACVNTIAYFPCKDCSEEESRVESAGGKGLRSSLSGSGASYRFVQIRKTIIPGCFQWNELLEPVLN